MKTTILYALGGVALAQAPGGGQINGGVNQILSSSTSVVGAAGVGAAAGVSSSTSVVGAAGAAAGVVSSSTSVVGAAGAAAGVVSSSTTSTVGAAGLVSSSSSTSIVGAAGAAAAVPTSSSSTAAISGTETADSGTVNSMDMGPWSDVDHIVGTWQSKSGMVVTGPDFYDPVHELLIDPGLPGISYSFTSDGFWEQAIYQITGDGSKPSCPTAVLIFQHGTYKINNNGSMTLTPFEEDGRQLLSEPCGDSSDESTYSHYVQPITFKRFEVLIDNYYGRYRLNLYGFDGAPVAPLYLAYKPPQMLPTETMNPTKGGSSAKATSANARVKRHLKNARELRKRGLNAEMKGSVQSKYFDYMWYAGMSLMVGGGVALAALS